MLRKLDKHALARAYDHYAAIRSGKSKPKQIAREFKNTFSWKGLRIHFVGVWLCYIMFLSYDKELTFARDTVSSVGLVRGDVFLSTSASAAHACHFRHALALDELRVKFMPEYFHEMNSQRGGSNDNISKYIIQKTEQTNTDQCTSPVTENSEKTMGSEIKEVWFAGTHSDVCVSVHNSRLGG